jgi:pimeloyl-ACP methyl ester carboxylesterase
MLYVGKTFLEEQLKEQEKHDPLQLGMSFGIPCLIIHGEDDPTVPVSAAIALELAIPDATIALIEGGDHVYNTPNPFSVDGIPSPQLADVWSAMQSWLKRQRGVWSCTKE